MFSGLDQYMQAKDKLYTGLNSILSFPVFRPELPIRYVSMPPSTCSTWPVM